MDPISLAAFGAVLAHPAIVSIVFIVGFSLVVFGFLWLIGLVD